MKIITYKKIIDVSSHQGSIDWKKVKADGIEGAIIRCGYAEDKPEYDDQCFLANVKGCIDNGIEWGTYLYSYANKVDDALSEAAHVERLLNKAYELYKVGPKLGIYYDLEDPNTTGKCTNGEILKFAQTFYNSLKRIDNSRDIGIYASLNWFNTKLTDDWYRDAPELLWIAHYTTNVPKEETDFLKYYLDYTMWQYTDKGSVNGIKGNVDMNVEYIITLKEEDLIAISKIDAVGAQDNSIVEEVVEIEEMESETESNAEIDSIVSIENLAPEQDQVALDSIENTQTECITETAHIEVKNDEGNLEPLPFNKPSLLETLKQVVKTVFKTLKSLF